VVGGGWWVLGVLWGGEAEVVGGFGEVLGRHGAVQVEDPPRRESGVGPRRKAGKLELNQAQG